MAETSFTDPNMAAPEFVESDDTPEVHRVKSVFHLPSVPRKNDFVITQSGPGGQHVYFNWYDGQHWWRVRMVRGTGS